MGKPSCRIKISSTKLLPVWEQTATFIWKLTLSNELWDENWIRKKNQLSLWLCKNQRSSSNHEQPHAPFHQHPKVTSHSQSSLATLNSLVSLRPEHLSGVKHRQKSCVEWHMQQGSSDTASSLLCVLCTWTSSCFLCLCSMPGLRKLIPWQGCFWPAFRDTEAAWKS